eukprot:scaffold95772_cov66-Phaeocystis_antarctica.AAC.2
MVARPAWAVMVALTARPAWAVAVEAVEVAEAAEAQAASADRVTSHRGQIAGLSGSAGLLSLKGKEGARKTADNAAAIRGHLCISRPRRRIRRASGNKRGLPGGDSAQREDTGCQCAAAHDEFWAPAGVRTTTGRDDGTRLNNKDKRRDETKYNSMEGREPANSEGNYPYDERFPSRRHHG